MNNARFIKRTALAAAGWLVASCLAVPSPAMAADGPHHLMTRLSPTGATPAASGKAKYTFVRSGSSLAVTTHGLQPGAYDIKIGGGVVGTLNVTADDLAAEGASRFLLDTSLSSGILFDPRGTSLEVVNQLSGATELFTSAFPADKDEEKTKIAVEAAFTSTGLQPAASGEAQYRSFKGRSKLVVKVAGLASGVYDLTVGGVPEARLDVAGLDETALTFDSQAPAATADDGATSPATGDGSHGHRRGTTAREGGALLLSFDPTGLPVALTLDGQTILLIDAFPAQ